MVLRVGPAEEQAPRVRRLETFDETPFRTWCAYDALGIAAALETDARVETTCAVCQAPIDLRFHGGVPEKEPRNAPNLT